MMKKELYNEKKCDASSSRYDRIMYYDTVIIFNIRYNSYSYGNEKRKVLPNLYG